MSSTTAGRKETERIKLIQEKCQTLLTQMLRDEDNKYCVDCDAKGPRWASWNLGVFLCIRCAGIHRNLGVHISRVKSVNLDSWTPEQVISLQQMGNSRARAVYEAQLPDGFRRPQTDTALESFIRAKYEHKKYLAREWVPPSPPKVDWAKEIDEELERLKRKKKAAQMSGSNSSGIGGVLGTSSGNEKKSSTNNATAKSSPLPAPLPKPKPNQIGGSSPKTLQRISVSSNSGESDLLGLSSPTKPMNNTSLGSNSGSLIAHDLNNDNFSSFLSASTTATPIPSNSTISSANGKGDIGQGTNTSLAQEEQDFFNQGSMAGCSGLGEKDKSGKLSKDSILALYGTNQSQPHNHNAHLNFGGFGHNMTPGYPQQQPPSQQQFMTPPNSVSMYNAPVMTAPNAFTAPAMNIGAATGGGFGAQFPPSTALVGGYAGIGGPAGAIGPTGNINLMQTNQSLLSGMSLFGGSSNAVMGAAHPQLLGNVLGMQQQQHQSPMASSLGGIPNVTAATGAANFQTPNSTTNLNQQFGNLNIGNVWQ